ncbi:hypothetical protein C8A00DRAFT_35826 [Chaetomidium leptoderma]|uniref:Uncharacterized protein n=1 Tax=Chaetomidium leptoderma TaxID=669021 RepID=A0AAN6VHA9_9PEZI|nr:hypothetical protein C8A00DRAFT_35826 [Chaetomidium leptoderma]
MCFKVPCLSKTRRATAAAVGEKHEMMDEKNANLEEDEDYDEEIPPAHGDARKHDRKRKSKGDYFRRMADQYLHDVSAAAAAGRAPPPPPFALLGDNAREQILVVLLDATATKLDNLESEANHRIHGLWMLNRGGKPLAKVEFQLHVEFVVAQFRETKNEIYKKLAWEHGEMRATEVFDILKVNERLPKDYLQILTENEDYPEPDHLLEMLEDMCDAKEKSEAAQEELGVAQEESEPAQEESEPAQEESEPAQEKPEPAQEKWDFVDWDGETRVGRDKERSEGGSEAHVDWAEDDLEMRFDWGEGTSEALTDRSEDDFEELVLVVVSSSSTL